MSVFPNHSAPATTLLLSRSDVAALVDPDSCIAAVEEAFRAHAEGRARGPASLGVMTEDGSYHVKAAGLRGTPGYFAAKTNANFPDNPARHGPAGRHGGHARLRARCRQRSRISFRLRCLTIYEHG